MGKNPILYGDGSMLLPNATDTASSVLENVAAKKPMRLTLTRKDGRVMIDKSWSDREAAIREVSEIMKVLPAKDRRYIQRKLREQYGLNPDPDLVRAATGSSPDPVSDGLRVNLMEFLDKWGKELKLERATGSRAHALRDAMDNGKLVTWDEYDPGGTLRYVAARESEVIGESFVVEHDWAAAFKGAQDFVDGAEYRLPFDHCCFEFQIGGTRVCALANYEEGGEIVVAALIETSFGWLTGANSFNTAATRLCADQIKAICVALEAEVTETEIVRAPHKLNRARERRGKLPLYDHHVVRLARRSRPASLPPAIGHNGAPDEITRKRLHFRRGHWRHYVEYKTWIKWMLCGDPDLGWIEKDYRL